MNARFKVVTLVNLTRTFEMEKEILAKAGAILVSCHDSTDDELLRILPDVDALLTGRNEITEKMINRMDRCKIIVRYGIGVDNIDVKAAARRNIAVSNTPDYCIAEVSDHTMALLLCGARKIVKANHVVKSGKWGIMALSPLWRLQGKTLGILGFGRIGRAVAEKAFPFGFNILICDPYAPKTSTDQSRFTFVDFDTLLREADYLTVHTPLTDQTRNMFSETEFKKMKPSCLFINAARGDIVVEEDLSKALKEGWIAGAALDALSKEPPDSDNPLLTMENVLITPHSAWYTEEAFFEFHRKAAEEVARVLQGEPGLYCV